MYTRVTRYDPNNINRVTVEVCGNKGSGTFVRNGWEQAILTARRYAKMFGAPCEVI